MTKKEGMVGKKSRLSPGGIALFLALVLLAMPLPSRALAATIPLKAILNGAQEVPPNTITSGVGEAYLIIDTLNGQLAGSLTFSGLTAPVTAAAIHGPAPAGMNAPVVALLPNFPLGVTAGTYASFNLVPPLTPAQVSAMLAGLYYLNLHTTLFPAGEIRGQLVVPYPIAALELLRLD
jgi:hypothetical protein